MSRVFIFVEKKVQLSETCLVDAPHGKDASAEIDSCGGRPGDVDGSDGHVSEISLRNVGKAADSKHGNVQSLG